MFKFESLDNRSIFKQFGFDKDLFSDVQIHGVRHSYSNTDFVDGTYAGLPPSEFIGQTDPNGFLHLLNFESEIEYFITQTFDVSALITEQFECV